VIATIPAPPGSSLELGPLSLHLYGVMIALGVIAAVWLCGRRAEAAGIATRDDIAAVAVWGVAGGIIGARLYHVATDWSRFSDDPPKILRIWEGGLGIPGGLLLGALAGIWCGRRRGIPIPELLTAAAPAIPLAQAIGRWGNYFNQELFGRPTTLPWALEVDAEHVPAGYPPGTTFHPTFLYESLWNFALCGVLLWIDRRFRLRPGRLMAVYVVGYSIGRFWVESLRIDEAHHVAGMRWNQWVALVAGGVGAAYLVIDWARHRGDEPAPPPDPAISVREESDTDA
jgi:prolipoprotein diacylglyceryl transferase